MNEDYFLYFEEIDWATRSEGNYSLLYAQDSIVFHKEGSSIGSSNDPLQKSCLSDYYSLRNRLRFTRRYYPLLLPATYIGLLIALLNRIRRGQIDRAAMIIGIFGEEK